MQTLLIIIIILLLLSFFPPVLTSDLSLESESRPLQHSKTLLSILTNLNNAVVCMVSILPQISISPVSFLDLWRLFQVHHLQLVSPSPWCSLVFQLSVEITLIPELEHLIHKIILVIMWHIFSWYSNIQKLDHYHIDFINITIHGKSKENTKSFFANHIWNITNSILRTINKAFNNNDRSITYCQMSSQQLRLSYYLKVALMGLWQAVCFSLLESWLNSHLYSLAIIFTVSQYLLCLFHVVFTSCAKIRT